MSSDEQAIRTLMETWMRATAKGDIDAVLSLMTDDVVFLVPGQPPMRGRESFKAGFEKVSKTHRIEGSSNLQEVTVSGNLAYTWNHLTVKMVPLAGGEANERSGYVLTVFRKEPDGQWRLARDANLLPH